jgi:hypothetical protein
VFFGTPEAIVDLNNHYCGAAFGVGELFWIEENYVKHQVLTLFESPEAYILPLPHAEESHFDTGGVYLVQTAISQESLVVAGMFKLAETSLPHEETVIYSQQVHEVTIAGVAEAAIIENTGMVALTLLLHSEVSSRSQE